MIQWPSTCLASRTCTPHAGAHPDFFHTLKLVVLDLKSKPATENEAEPVEWIFSTKMAQHKALVLCKLNSHAKIASDTAIEIEQLWIGGSPYRLTARQGAKGAELTKL